MGNLETPSVCLHKLFPVFNQRPDAFILHFVSPPMEKYNGEFSFAKSLINTFSSRLRIIDQTYFAPIFQFPDVRVIPVPKFHTSYDVFIIDLPFTRTNFNDVKLWRSFKQLHEMLIDYITVPTTLMLYLALKQHNNAGGFTKLSFGIRKTKWICSDGFAAVKILIRFPISCTNSADVDLSSLCDDKLTNEHEKIIKFATDHGNVLLLHKTLYQKTAGNLMTYHYFIQFHTFPFISHCYSRFGKLNRVSICNSNFMTLLTLIDYNTANKSLNQFWMRSPQVLLNMGKNLHDPFKCRSEVVTDIQFLAEHYKGKYLTTQIYPQRLMTSVPLYCLYRKGTQGFRIETLIWIEALPADIWGPMGVILSVVLLQFLFSGNFRIPKNATFFGFCYENELTSLVIVAPNTQAYTTFAALLLARYKVLQAIEKYSAKIVYENRGM
ncbi:unnamed protein product [Orchesella dallaii]|uniref:Uncharacterized protein n=1 Tax=Orchesella dallaii TaxID=48710 RepID=A0ABP1RHA7_9HEXA